MAIVDGAGLPVEICAVSASPAELTLVQYTIKHQVVEDTPQKTIGDKVYDCAKSWKTEKSQTNTGR